MLGSILTVVLMIAMLAFGAVQIWAGFVGLDHQFGAVWAWLAIVPLLFLRSLLPLTVGAFFCALNVWGWPWYGAALFAAPGLAFALPGAIVGLYELAKASVRRRG